MALNAFFKSQNIPPTVNFLLLSARVVCECLYWYKYWESGRHKCSDDSFVCNVGKWADIMWH